MPINHDHVMVTGAAGFIGSFLCEALLAQGRRITGVDNFSPNYAEAAKRGNLSTLVTSKQFTFVDCDVCSEDFRNILSSSQPGVVVHLAATPGVRPSIDHVLEYVDNNVRGTANVLTSATAAGVSKVVFASSSSVYGDGPGRACREDDALVPLSPYAATKVSGEALCRSFAACHDITVTCLRFFTVYGPRQRPDMAICKLAHCISSGKPFQMNGDGKSSRDYTYISDIVSGICASLGSDVPFEVFNLGSANPINLHAMIELVSEALGRSPILEEAAFPSSEPRQTFADISSAAAKLGYKPSVDFREGIAQFAAWFAEMQKHGMA